MNPNFFCYILKASSKAASTSTCFRVYIKVSHYLFDDIDANTGVDLDPFFAFVFACVNDIRETNEFSKFGKRKR